MKNFIKSFLILLIALVAMPTMAQGVEQTVSKTMSLEQYYFLSTADIEIIGSVDSSIIYSVFLQKPELALYDIRVNLDSVAAPNVAIGLYGKSFTSDSWTQIGTDLSYTGGTADTTISFTQVSTSVNYRYLGIKMTSQTTASSIVCDWVGVLFKIKQ